MDRRLALVRERSGFPGHLRARDHLHGAEAVGEGGEERGPELRRQGLPDLAAFRELEAFAQLGTDLDIMRSAEEFLRVHGHERWLLYLHLMDIHEYVYDEDTAVFG